MIHEGDTAPNFTVPIAQGETYDDIGTFTLSDHYERRPVVLAFYPAAFTSGCTREVCQFRDSMSQFKQLDAAVFGVSVDLPYAQNIFIQEYDLNFSMLSDVDHNVIETYGVIYPTDFGFDMAERSIFVIDETGEVLFRWVRDGENPDFEWLMDETITAVEAARST